MTATFRSGSTVATRPRYHHTLFRRQVSAVSLRRVERASACGRFVLWMAALGSPRGSIPLLQYWELFSRIDRFGIIYVAADEPMSTKAAPIFRRLCGNGVEVGGCEGSRYRAVARALSGSRSV